MFIILWIISLFRADKLNTIRVKTAILDSPPGVKEGRYSEIRPAASFLGLTQSEVLEPRGAETSMEQTLA